MKFGKRLDDDLMEVGWEDHYLRFRLLKKVIKVLSLVGNDADLFRDALQVFPRKRRLLRSLAENEQIKCTACKRYAVFTTLVEGEVQHVRAFLQSTVRMLDTSFYTDIEPGTHEALRDWKRESAGGDETKAEPRLLPGSPVLETLAKFATFVDTLGALRRFTVVNNVALEKIVKKFKKRVINCVEVDCEPCGPQCARLMRTGLDLDLRDEFGGGSAGAEDDMLSSGSSADGAEFDADEAVSDGEEEAEAVAADAATDADVLFHGREEAEIAERGATRRRGGQGRAWLARGHGEVCSDGDEKGHASASARLWQSGSPPGRPLFPGVRPESPARGAGQLATAGECEGGGAGMLPGLPATAFRSSSIRSSGPSTASFARSLERSCPEEWRTLQKLLAAAERLASKVMMECSTYYDFVVDTKTQLIEQRQMDKQARNEQRKHMLTRLTTHIDVEKQMRFSTVLAAGVLLPLLTLVVTYWISSTIYVDEHGLVSVLQHKGWFISASIDRAPASNIGTLGLTTTLSMLTVIIFVKHNFVKMQLRGRAYMFTHRIATGLGLLSCFCGNGVAAFQHMDHATAHNTFAVTFFVLGMLHVVLETYLDLRLGLSLPRTRQLRLGASGALVLCVLFFIGPMGYVLSHGSDMCEQDIYWWKLIAAFFEVSALACFLIWFASYHHVFRALQFKMSVQYRVRLGSAEDLTQLRFSKHHRRSFSNDSLEELDWRDFDRKPLHAFAPAPASRSGASRSGRLSGSATPDEVRSNIGLDLDRLSIPSSRAFVRKLHTGARSDDSTF
jgi:hypothetical protein